MIKNLSYVEIKIDRCATLFVYRIHLKQIFTPIILVTRIF